MDNFQGGDCADPSISQIEQMAIDSVVDKAMKIARISSEYESNKLMLAKLLSEGSFMPFEADATNHACYFCRKRITGKMHVLLHKEDGYTTSIYFLDDECYNQPKKDN